ncbi:transcriptional regulator [Mycolicibacterium sp. CH28]|jgi:DNA-binding HxlR family transcriptional regulator|uniref:winged helix-turn-helix transcriptional regulator n=1 Tax=Mycolicibacterium sp. CH28 TaxID=2512237 RepID=UPI0010808175|nr:helix-turn-helix domain-containing protein [Mycolicibacterium sp. CH28]TGD86537.1 transcriptional regulator [Mycolicibacterium sp. CH28]
MPLGRDYAGQDCALARALAILGERWTMLIVRDAFHGLTRYDEFLRSLGLATNMLSARLQKLVEHGIMEHTGPRGSYHLTQKGRDLFPTLVTLMAWADRYEPGPDGPEVSIRHIGCDHDAGGVLRCEHCGEPIELSDLRVVPTQESLGPDGQPLPFTPPQLAAWAGRSRAR